MDKVGECEKGGGTAELLGKTEERARKKNNRSEGRQKDGVSVGWEPEGYGCKTSDAGKKMTTKGKVTGSGERTA